MKKLTILIILTANISFGQNFFENESSEEPMENNQGSMFAEHTQPPPESPDQGVEGGPAAPGDDVPIDKWGFLLPILGMATGIYYLRRKSLASN